MKLPKHQAFIYFPPRVVQVNILAANHLKKTFAVQTAVEGYLDQGVVHIETEEDLKQALKVESFGRSFS